MKYKMHVKEIDHQTNYPLDVLSGLTGLGQHTIAELADQGRFAIHEEGGQKTVNGQEFLSWAESVNNIVEVEETQYSSKKVNE